MNPQQLQILTDLMKEYQALADERNRLLHNPIGINEQLYIMLRDKSPQPGAIPYKTEAISIETIDNLSGRIATFNLKATILGHAISKLPISAQS